MMFTSCGKSSDSNVLTNTPYTMTAAIHGTAWTATTVSVIEIYDTTHGGDTVFISGISPVGSQTQAVVLKLYRFNGNGTYGIGNGVASASGTAYYAVGKDTTLATTGKVDINFYSYNTSIQGSFYFQSDSVKADSMAVLNGYFNSVFQRIVR